MKITNPEFESPLQPEEEEEFFDVGEAAVPKDIQLTKMTEYFGDSLENTEAVKSKVRTLFVPMALLTYKDLLESGDPKIRKSAADAIMEIADIKGPQKQSGGGVGAINFNLGGEGKNNLLSALGALSKGEIIQDVEIIGAEDD